MTERICPYCNQSYEMRQGQGRRKVCYKKRCVEKHIEAQKRHDRELHRKERICPYCNMPFKTGYGPGHNKRTYCFKLDCIEKHMEVMRKRKRECNTRYAKIMLTSLRREDQPKAKSFIVCRVCHKRKPGPFDVCFDCREQKRNQIDTSYMYIADDVRVFSQ